MEHEQPEIAVPFIVFLPPTWCEVVSLSALYHDQSVKAYLHDTLDFFLDIHRTVAEGYTPEFRDAAGIYVDANNEELRLLSDVKGSIPHVGGWATQIAAFPISKAQWSHIEELADAYHIELPYLMQSAVHLRENIANYEIAGYQLWYVNREYDHEVHPVPHVSQSEV